jgi:hypothetical protein
VRLARACAAHVRLGPATLLLYDVTTLYFETDEGDGFREPGFSKERRLEPQIVVGLLTDRAGFPLMVHAFEGNRAETTTMVPVLRAILDAHHPVCRYAVPRDLRGQITSADPQQRPELESLCFMFFDMAAIDLGDDTVLDVLEDTLALESAACQRSALHGLGHAHFHVPQDASSIVDRWLQKHPRAPAELRDYALAARTGNVM